MRTSREVAEKVASEREPRPQRLKPHSKQGGYRSGEPLRHPKSSATSSFSAASRLVLMVALVFLSNILLSNFCRSGYATAQSTIDRETDQVAAERVLGPRWKQLSRRAGMIFAGTVLSTTAQTGTTENVTTKTVAPYRAVPGATPAVQLSFRVDEAIAGVEPGQVLTIHEWAGAWSMYRPMSKGQHILIFLYPPSRLGFASPVGGSVGQIALDASGKNVVEGNAAAIDVPHESFAQPRVPVAGATVLQLARAIRGARSEEE